MLSTAESADTWHLAHWRCDTVVRMALEPRSPLLSARICTSRQELLETRRGKTVAVQGVVAVRKNLFTGPWHFAHWRCDTVVRMAASWRWSQGAHCFLHRLAKSPINVIALYIFQIASPSLSRFKVSLLLSICNLQFVGLLAASRLAQWRLAPNECCRNPSSLSSRHTCGIAGALSTATVCH